MLEAGDLASSSTQQGVESDELFLPFASSASLKLPFPSSILPAAQRCAASKFLFE